MELLNNVLAVDEEARGLLMEAEFFSGSRIFGLHECVTGAVRTEGSHGVVPALEPGQQAVA